ncbi:MAG: HIT family protein [Verrucomicrobia bacterium]|jgi:histidine triad (HIT) family protein|nr:HIT family protein [Verrucomicrobiota bacterium]
MSDDCIFCKLVAGEIPSTKVYEDEHTLAFMDISPLIEGHTLVIPKAHHDPITETPVDVLGRCMAVVKRVAQAQMSLLGADGVNLHQANGAAAGQVVPHLHFHVIPRFEDDGHHWNWSHKQYASTEAMAAMGARLKSEIEGADTGIA